MASVLSNSAANSALDYLLRPGNRYVSLHTSNPGPLGEFDSEVAGGSYERQPTTFSPSGSRSSGNEVQATFADMPAGTVTHIGVWDAPTGGHMIAAKALSSAIAVLGGYNFIVPVNNVVVTFL